MAEAVLFDVAKEIVKKLGSQAIREIAQWWSFKNELEKLNDTVSSIKAVLLDAEERSMESHQVKVWLGMLKEAIYDADDLVDEFSTDALRQQVMTGNVMAKEVQHFFSSSNRLAYGRKMSHKIKGIRNRLDEIAGNRRFYLEERSGERDVKAKGRELTHSSSPEVVIGREHDKQKIVDLLLSSNYEENISVIPIIGIGGLGKTTLAQHVYNDERIKRHFELRKWACISDDFDVKLIVEKIVESRNCEMEDLKNLLHREINGKKYLMVLDDVWSDDFEKWCGLRNLLVGGATGSKIVITTRLRKVAEMTRPVAIYELKGLSDEESWSLFKQIALKPGQVLTPSHGSIGKEIVAKCLGVPLAIRTMGGLLYFKDSESEWLSFKNKEVSRIDQKESDILPTLKLSYSHLPSHLKQCFAYCKLFPKGYQIEVEMLIQLWIAQGYVKSSYPNECLGDIGVEYFEDLLWRSFFQEVEKDDFGNYETCKIHDLMHDVATLVAGDECASSSNSEVGISNARTRHASFHQCRVSASLFKANKLRTLLLFGEGELHIKKEEGREMFSNLRCLRVLGLYNLNFGALSSSIDKLKHLRYLDLSYGCEQSEIKMKTLPDSITNLQNLQVLKLNGHQKLTQLPKDIKKLVNLTHLENSLCALTHMPRGIGQLALLEKLYNFVLARDSAVSKLGAGVSELHGLNKLRGELRITNLGRMENGAVECKAANMKEKQHLQFLGLRWNHPYDDSASAREVENDEMELEALEPHRYLKGVSVEFYMGVKLASWFSSLTNLVEIFLYCCRNIKCLPPFHQFPFLKKLSIFNLRNLEYIGGDCEGEISLNFPSLENLELWGCPDLKGWNVEKPHLLQFPSLSHLSIWYCPSFTFVPLSPSLKRLEYVGSNAKSFEQIPIAKIVASQSTSSSSSSQLEYLFIWDIEDLEFLPKLLLSRLTSLQHLRIKGCSGITTLSPDDKDDGMEWQGLKSLRSLQLCSIPNLMSLPMGLQHVTSLRRLYIEDCPNFTSLPEWMHNRSSLQNLDIRKCPQLSKRCENSTADDWPKIAHIPDISIDAKTIQRNGCYLL